jgi:hypothetical protein
MRRLLPPIRELHCQRSDHSRKGPFGGMPGLPAYQLEWALPSDGSHKSTIADSKLENGRRQSGSTFLGDEALLWTQLSTPASMHVS